MEYVGALPFPVAQELFEDAWPPSYVLLRWQLGYRQPAMMEEAAPPKAAARREAPLPVGGNVRGLKDVPLYAREFIIETHNAGKN